MRIVLVWIVGLVLIAMVITAWYTAQPLLAYSIDLVDNFMQQTNWNSTRSSQTFTILDFLSLIWGPIIVIAILVWMFISAQRRDVESEIYA